MKVKATLVLVVFILGLIPLSVSAQEGTDASELIVLNDATPGIDVVITPSADTTGAVALEVNNVSVMVTDVVGNVVFQATDAHITGMSFQFAPNAGAHTLTIERLPGATQGFVRIVAQPEIMTSGETALVSGNALALEQEADFPLSGLVPSSTATISIPEDNQGAITARFPGSPITAQLVNSEDGSIVATLTGSLIDGFSVTVNSGQYEMLLINNDASRETLANIRVNTPQESDFAVLVGATTDTNVVVSDTAQPTASAVDTTSTCAITINTASINLRSGPGTGYSVNEYAFRNETYPVGGVSQEENWLLIGTEDGSAWMNSQLGNLSGDCNNLTVYDIPYRDATTPQVVIQQPQVSIYNDDDDEYEHDEHDEHEYGEHEDDDD
jgi:uncharacterized protein YraI